MSRFHFLTRHLNVTGAELCGLAAAALLLVACASTRVDVVWSNPQVPAHKVEGSLLVVGLTRDPAVRRVYEDALAAELSARGISAIRSYQVLPDALGADTAQPLLAAARRAGATAVLSSAVVGHEHLARGVAFDEPAPRWMGAYEGWYGHYWPYVNRHTEIQVTERYLAASTLVDVSTGVIRWTVRTHTDAGADIGKDVRQFAAVIVGAMGSNGLL